MNLSEKLRNSNISKNTVGESRGESTTFQKNVSLKDNVLDRDIFLLWSITH